MRSERVSMTDPKPIRTLPAGNRLPLTKRGTVIRPIRIPRALMYLRREGEKREEFTTVSDTKNPHHAGEYLMIKLPEQHFPNKRWRWAPYIFNELGKTGRKRTWWTPVLEDAHY